MHSWRCTDPQSAEAYLARYRCVAENADLAIDVIYAEYLVREQSGERPDLGEFQRWFPQYSDVLAEQINLHRAIEALGLSEESDEASPRCRFFEPARESSCAAIRRDVPDSGTDRPRRHGGRLGRSSWARPLRRLEDGSAIDATNEELLARFRSEVRQSVAVLDHPHIVENLRLRRARRATLSGDGADGGRVAGRCMNGTPWQPREPGTCSVSWPTAVHFAHERQTHVHRDLKPANVLIASPTEPLNVKITDFGLAKLYAEETSSHTKSNAFFGTPSYMAPEQAAGKFQDDRSGQRYLRAGRNSLRSADRPTAVSWRLSHGNAAVAAFDRARVDASAGAADAARFDDDLRQVPARRHRSPICHGRRVTRRSRALFGWRTHYGYGPDRRHRAPPGDGAAAIRRWPRPLLPWHFFC